MPESDLPTGNSGCARGVPVVQRNPGPPARGETTPRAAACLQPALALCAHGGRGITPPRALAATAAAVADAAAAAASLSQTRCSAVEVEVVLAVRCSSYLHAA